MRREDIITPELEWFFKTFKSFDCEVKHLETMYIQAKYKGSFDQLEMDAFYSRLPAFVDCICDHTGEDRSLTVALLRTDQVKFETIDKKLKAAVNALYKEKGHD